MLVDMCSVRCEPQKTATVTTPMRGSFWHKGVGPVDVGRVASDKLALGDPSCWSELDTGAKEVSV